MHNGTTINLSCFNETKKCSKLLHKYNKKSFLAQLVTDKKLEALNKAQLRPEVSKLRFADLWKSVTTTQGSVALYRTVNQSTSVPVSKKCRKFTSAKL